MKNILDSLKFESIEVLKVKELKTIKGGYVNSATCGRTGQVYPNIWSCHAACGGGCV